jgi:hypothetical protein
VANDLSDVRKREVEDHRVRVEGASHTGTSARSVIAETEMPVSILYRT